MAYQGLKAPNNERRTGEPPALTTNDMDVNFTPQWMLSSKSPSSVLPEPGKNLANPPWEPVAHKEVKWRSDDDMKGDRWGPGFDKDHNRDRNNDSVFRGGKWKDDERDSMTKPRWGAAPDEGHRWNGAFSRAQAEPALRNERWTDASRGRGRPLEEKWTRDRDNLGWLPGMGDEPSTRDKRWNDAGFDQFDANGQEKWRAPGAARDPAPHGRGRGLGRGKPVFKGPDANERWGSPTRNGQPVATAVPGTKYNKNAMVEVYNTMVGRYGSPLPMPEAADTKLPGLIYDEAPEHDNGVDPAGLSAAVKKKERGSSSDEVHAEAVHAPAYQPPFKRAPAHPAAGPDRKREFDAAAGHGMGHHFDELGVAGGKAAAPKEIAPTMPVISPQAFAADQWVYKDPQGNIQGPFTKVDILDWFEAGFFPPELPIKSALDPADSPFVNLSSMLKMWAHVGANRAPPGFVQVPAAVQGPTAGVTAAVGLEMGLSAEPTPGLADPLIAQVSVAQPGQGLQPTDPVAIPMAKQPQPGLPDSNIFNQLNGNKPEQGIRGPTTMQSPFQNDANTPPANATGYPGSWDPAANAAWLPHEQLPNNQTLPNVPHALLPQQHAQNLINAGSGVPAGNLMQQQHSTQSALSQHLLLTQQTPPIMQHTSQAPVAMPGLTSHALSGSLPYNQFSLHNAWSHTAPPATQLSATPPQQLPPQFANNVQDPAVQHQLLGSSLHGPGMGLPADPAIQAAMPKTILPQNVAPMPDLRPPADLAKVWSASLQGVPAVPAAPHAMAPPAPAATAYPPVQVEPALHVQPVQPTQESVPAPQPAVQPTAAPRRDQPVASKPAPSTTKSKAAAKAEPPKTETVASTASADTASSDPTPFLEVSKKKKKQQAKAAKEAAAAAAAAAAVVTSPPTSDPPAARIPDPVPEPPRPETKPAPWAAAAIRPPAQKSLLEIQQEEQARLAAAAAAQAAQAAEKQPVVAAPAPPASGWAKIASVATAPAPVAAPVAPVAPVAPPVAPAPALTTRTSGPTPALTTRTSLREILEEEERAKQAAAAAAPQPVEPPVGTGPGPRGSTFGEILASRLDPANGNNKAPAAPWAASARPNNVPNLRDVMFEECAADLEGGYVDEDISDLLQNLQQFRQANNPPPAPAPVAPVTPASPAAPPPYNPSPWGGRAAPPRPAAAPAPTPAPAPRAAAQPASTMPNGARHPPAASAANAAVHEEDEELFWDYGQKQQAPPAAPAVKAAGVAMKGATAASKAVAAAPKAAARPAAPAPAPAPAVRNTAPELPRTTSVEASYAPVEAADTPLLIGNLEVSEEFQDWCKKKMMEFNGNEDLTLVEFLWGLPSGGEVAEYCQVYLGNGPAVSSFVAEFIRRKAAETTRQKSKGKKKGGATASVAQASKPGQSKPVAGQAVADDGWTATAKAKGKKTKGKKLDPKMLGFTSHYAVLATE